MFGQSRSVDAKFKAWFDLLERAEPATRRGELVVRSLIEDANVCPALQTELEAFVSREPEVLHAVFPAAQIQACDVVGPLQEDPPNNYRSIRLDNPPRFS